MGQVNSRIHSPDVISGGFRFRISTRRSTVATEGLLSFKHSCLTDADIISEKRRRPLHFTSIPIYYSQTNLSSDAT
jgi:hypothetical protein